MKIKLDEFESERIKRYLELRKKGYKLKKIKKFRDKEKSKAYIKFIAKQIKERKDQFKIKI